MPTYIHASCMQACLHTCVHACIHPVSHSSMLTYMHSESLAMSLRAFWDSDAARRIRGSTDIAHKAVYNIVRGDLGLRRHVMTTFLLQRAQRWSEDNDDMFQAYYSLVAHRPPPDLLSSVLRTLLFGWCTSTRFHHPPAACWFCEALAHDRQAHYLACPVTRTWYEERYAWWTQPEDAAMHAWLFIKLHSKIGQSPHSLLDARLKELRRRHKQVRELVPFISHEVRPD